MRLIVGECKNYFIIECNENREGDLEPGHIDTFDAWETKADLDAFKDAPLDGEGDFDPSLN